MRLARVSSLPLVSLVLVLSASPALASFHFMQIEQVIGGVNGDATAQAIQLRQRFAGQNLVSQARLYAYDSTGAGQILLKDMTTNVASGAAGRRILLTSANFPRPDNSADFVLTNLIPASYFNGGRITFQDDFGTVIWSLAFGGSNYTGSNSGSFDNDSNGNYGPPFAGPLPSTTRQALLFQGAAAAQSIQNSTDYALTAGAATFTNNAAAGFLVPNKGDTDFDGDVDLADLGNLAGNYNTLAGATWPMGNFDGDGDVDLADLGLLASNYSGGEVQAVADFEALTGVPEPAMLALSCLAGLLTMRRRIGCC